MIGDWAGMGLPMIIDIKELEFMMQWTDEQWVIDFRARMARQRQSYEYLQAAHPQFKWG